MVSCAMFCMTLPPTSYVSGGKMDMSRIYTVLLHFTYCDFTRFVLYTLHNVLKRCVKGAALLHPNVRRGTTSRQ